MGKVAENQWMFLQDVAKLIAFASNRGYRLTAGEMYRTKEQQEIYLKAGLSKANTSQHQKRLAVDLNLFVDDGEGFEWEPGICPEWIELGEYWEGLSPENRWGGNWDRDDVAGELGETDFNHFERRG